MDFRITRRSFVMQMGLAAAAEMAAPLSKCLRSPARIAIVGSGENARQILREISRTPEVEIVALCGHSFSNPVLSRSGFARHTPPVVVTDFADVLQIRDIDAIVLLTPDRTQRQQLPMILAARKHCYFSSSAITSVEDAEKLRSAAGSVQRVFFPASHQPLPQASIPVKWSALRLGTVREIRLNLETPLNTAHFDRHNFFSKVIPDLALISAFLNPNAPVAAQALLGPNGRKDIVTLQYQIGRSDCPPPHWLKLTVCDGPIVHSRIGFYGDRGRLEIANEDRHPALDPQMRAFLSAIRSVDQDLTSLLLLGRGWKLAEIGRRAIAAHGRAVLFN